jgi:hypothetical protein
MLRFGSSLVSSSILSAVFFLISSQTAGATPFVLVTGVGANLGCLVPDTCNPEGEGDHDADFFIPGPNNGAGYVSVTDQADDILGFNDTHFTYLAEANASFGTLQAGASGSYSDLSDSTRVAFAFAYVTDQLTLTAHDMNGNDLTGSGTLDISFLLDGELQGGPDGGGGALFTGVAVGPTSELFGPDIQAHLFQYATSGPHAGPLPSGPIVAPVTFVWGEPFYLTMILAVGAGTPITSLLDCYGGDACLTPVSGAGSGTADFYHTMSLTGLQPKDALGNPVLNTRFVSGSTAVYSIDGIVAQPVPEPGSLLLLGTGLAVAFKRRRRT